MSKDFSVCERSENYSKILYVQITQVSHTHVTCNSIKTYRRSLSPDLDSDHGHSEIYPQQGLYILWAQCWSMQAVMLVLFQR